MSSTLPGGRLAPVMAALLLLAGAAGLQAQDVSVSPLQWTEWKDPPDELPVRKGTLRMRFPEEMRATPDLGYIVYDVVVDAKGRVIVLHPHPTLTTLLGAENQAQQKWDFAPARRAGKPVNSAFSFAVIFNPASAAEKIPDATPRLLEAALVTLPRPKGRSAQDNIPDELVTVEVLVDQRGAVAEVTDAPAARRAPIAIALKNWRFAPARQAGQPVAAKVRVPVILRTADGAPYGKITQQPRVVFQARPVYPFAMRASRMRGEVVVDFIVDIEGRVRNAYVVRSLNPSFDDPALEAVQKWRFEPGQAGNRPIAMHMQVPIVFTLDDTVAGGGDGMETKQKADLSKLPPELRYDTPPRLRGSVRAVYPHAALAAGREGRAVVRFLIDERGRVYDAAVAEASAPEFGQALLAAIEHFEYEPALQGGRPCKALLGFIQEFKRDSAYQIVSDPDLALLRREQKRPESIGTLGDLDAPLKPISQRPPRFPTAQLGKVDRAEAVIDFLVDEDGRVRLPRAVSATDEAFAYAAIQGVAAWRFEEPRRGGRAAVIRVRVPIGFSMPAGPK